jgi:hypothetical protein
MRTSPQFKLKHGLYGNVMPQNHKVYSIKQENSSGSYKISESQSQSNGFFGHLKSHQKKVVKDQTKQVRFDEYS